AGAPSSPQRSFEFLTAVILNYLSLIETCSRNSSTIKAKLGVIVHRLAVLQHSGNLQTPLQCCLANGPGYGSCPPSVATVPTPVPSHGPPHQPQSDAALRDICPPCGDIGQAGQLPQHPPHPQTPYWVHHYPQPLMNPGHLPTQGYPRQPTGSQTNAPQGYPRQPTGSQTNAPQAVNPPMGGPTPHQTSLPNSASAPYCHNGPTTSPGGTDSQSAQPAPMGNQHFCTQLPHPHVPYVQAPLGQAGHHIRPHFSSGPPCYTDPWRAAGYPPVAFNIAGASPTAGHPPGGGFYPASDFYFCQPTTAGIYAMPSAGVLSSAIPATVSYAQPHPGHHRTHLHAGE
ncbi:hypothetical protein BIW11_04871, partial [Tropilaelaps mercedesae]